MTSELSDLCVFADGRVAVANLDLNTYISTENMLPNKEGITRSAGLPTVSHTQSYQVEDVLVSNIRPYFRKIWLPEFFDFEDRKPDFSINGTKTLHCKPVEVVGNIKEASYTPIIRHDAAPRLEVHEPRFENRLRHLL